LEVMFSDSHFWDLLDDNCIGIVLVKRKH